MRRYFNTEGQCEPEEHYMIRLDDRLEKIKRLFIDRGKYFVINKGRQYGKTTTLRALLKYLKSDYIALFIDFQGAGTAEFENEAAFSTAFAKMFMKAFCKADVDHGDELVKPLAGFAKETENVTLMELFNLLSNLCAAAGKPIVLMIDEVDSAGNNQVFIDFLALLRSYYIVREDTPIFHSVILAGVYDIKNLKLKIRPDSEHQYNSPWNIAARFNMDMSFSIDQIAVMLGEYEADNRTGMDVEAAAQEIYQYTSGYPYLVSAICKYLDEEVPGEKGFEDIADVWTSKGISEAVKILLNESAPLFGSMMRHINEYPDLKKMLYAMLFQGERVAYNPDNKTIELARMFGYIVNNNGRVQVANRIFETRLYNLFLSEEELSSAMSRAAKQDETHGRKFFLLYLKPIINGTGNYYIEAQTRDARRTDVIVDYMGEQFVIELKIWRGNEYHERGEKQLLEYLEYYHLDKGYMLSFNFNQKKETGTKSIELEGRTIIEAVV